MVHVRKCPCEWGRGRPSAEWYTKEHKPMIYCMGWSMQDADPTFAPECCKNCKDWVWGDQPQEDLDNYLKENPDVHYI